MNILYYSIKDKQTCGWGSLLFPLGSNIQQGMRDTLLLDSQHQLHCQMYLTGRDLPWAHRGRNIPWDITQMGVLEWYQSPCKHIQHHIQCRWWPICCCIDQQGTVKERSLSCWFDSNDQLGSLYSSSQNPSCKNRLDNQLARLLCLDRTNRLDKEYRPTNTRRKVHSATFYKEIGTLLQISLWWWPVNLLELRLISPMSGWSG